MADGPEAQTATALVPILRDRTAAYLRAEMGLTSTTSAGGFHAARRLRMGHLTSMVGLGGDISVMVALSFTRPVLEYVAARMTEGTDVSDLDVDDMLADAAGEMVNTVAGQSIRQATRQGASPSVRLVSLTPPMTFAEAQSMSLDKDAVCCTVHFDTPAGALDLRVIAARWRDGPADRLEGETT